MPSASSSGSVTLQTPSESLSAPSFAASKSSAWSVMACADCEQSSQPSPSMVSPQMVLSLSSGSLASSMPSASSSGSVTLQTPLESLSAPSFAASKSSAWSVMACADWEQSSQPSPSMVSPQIVLSRSDGSVASSMPSASSSSSPSSHNPSASASSPSSAVLSVPEAQSSQVSMSTSRH